MKRQARILQMAGIAAMLCPLHAGAEFPDKPVRLIVPQAAGSATDTIARMLAPELAAQLGQPVVPDNRPGGALVIGLEIVARSTPDGYTIGLGPVGGMAISPNMVSKLPYDILKDFQPIGLISRGHMMLAVTNSLPVRSVTELIDYAKKNPGKLVNASSGNGTPEEFGALIRTEYVKWGEVIRRSGAKID